MSPHCPRTLCLPHSSNGAQRLILCLQHRSVLYDK
uniref:Uncharacterized protein n=1 Tax=Anguilla anguilla TaxID=7936 RepID=A0A0E9QIS9_ANGAN